MLMDSQIFEIIAFALMCDYGKKSPYSTRLFNTTDMGDEITVTAVMHIRDDVYELAFATHMAVTV